MIYTFIVRLVFFNRIYIIIRTRQQKGTAIGTTYRFFYPELPTIVPVPCMNFVPLTPARGQILASGADHPLLVG